MCFIFFNHDHFILFGSSPKSEPAFSRQATPVLRWMDQPPGNPKNVVPGGQKASRSSTRLHFCGPARDGGWNSNLDKAHGVPKKCPGYSWNIDHE